MSEQRFEILIEQYSQQVINTAYRILGCAHIAQDVHQEVFIAIWRRWHKFNGQVNWPGYLYRTTVRKALQHAREARKTPTLIDNPENFTTREKPDGSLRTQELQQKLAICLSKLPKRQSEVFVLSRLEGLSHAEIAGILNCSPETVRVHLHRAIKRLVLKMKDYLE